MIKDCEVKKVVDKLFEEEEGQDVEFGEVKLVSEDWLKRHLEYEDVKKVFNAYYKKVDEEEEKHAKEVFDKLKEDVKDHEGFSEEFKKGLDFYLDTLEPVRQEELDEDHDTRGQEPGALEV